MTWLLRFVDGEERAEAERVLAAFEAPPGAEPADPAVRALAAGEAAREALAAGRVGELVSHVRDAARHAPPSMPWLGMYVASLLQAAFRFTGSPVLLAEAIDACKRVADDVTRPRLAVPARGLLGSIHLLSGAFHATVECCDAGIELAAASGLAEDRAPSLAHQFRGYVLFEWNRLAAAEEALLRAWRLAGDEGRGVRSGVARMLARLCAEQGRRDEADAWIEGLERIVHEPMTLRNREWLMAVRVGHTRGTGDVRSVEEWLRTWDYHPRTLAALDDAALASRLHELDQVLALLESSEQWTAVRDVAAAIVRGAGAHRSWFAVRALGADAVALEAEGRAAAADTRWAEALERGTRGSFVRAHIEGSPLRVRLLERAQAAQGPDGEAARVLRAMSGDGAGDGAAARDCPLTDRQQAVLRLVARGASNKTVARELDVSLSTVKTHLRQAFARLGASSRTHAVARAREHGWI